jgi:hypothetical protein
VLDPPAKPSLGTPAVAVVAVANQEATVPGAPLVELPPTTLAVAIDPGKAAHRVWLASGERGVIGAPVTLPVLREGLEALSSLIAEAGCPGPPVIGLEATGALHRAWAGELERRYPGCVRVLAPSQTKAARMQMGARAFKSDDRDCAAQLWLLRRGSAGRRPTRRWPPRCRRC